MLFHWLSKMAPIMGFESEKGLCLNVVVTEEDLQRLNGDSGTFYAGTVYRRALEEIQFNYCDMDPKDVHSVCKMLPDGHVGLPSGILFQRIEPGRYVQVSNGASTMESETPHENAELDDSTISQAPASTPSQDENFQKKQWTDAKVRHLVALFQDFQDRFSNNLVKKKDTWEKIAKEMNKEGGVQFTAEDVDRKWRKLKDRYKKIKDQHSSTGQGRSNWPYMDLLSSVLEKDPAVNPPIVITAGASFSAEQREGMSPSPPNCPSVSSTPSSGSSCSRKRRASSPPGWMLSYMERCEQEMQALQDNMKQLVDEEKRRNDLLKKLVDKLN